MVYTPSCKVSVMDNHKTLICQKLRTYLHLPGIKMGTSSIGETNKKAETYNPTQINNYSQYLRMAGKIATRICRQTGVRNHQLAPATTTAIKTIMLPPQFNLRRTRRSNKLSGKSEKVGARDIDQHHGKALRKNCQGSTEHGAAQQCDDAAKHCSQRGCKGKRVKTESRLVLRKHITNEEYLKNGTEKFMHLTIPTK